MSKQSTKSALRSAMVEAIREYLTQRGEDTGLTASNKINFPTVDSEGNDEWVVITVTVPTGAEKGTEPYDGYAERTAYEMKQAEKAEKAKIAAEKKAKKIAADEKKRALAKAAKEAKAKAEAEANAE